MTRLSLSLPLVMILGVTACGAQEAPANAVKSEQTSFIVETLADNLNHPWAVEFLPSGDYLITEREGALVRLSAKGERTEITGLPTNIATGGQGGLLDVILAPDFETSRRIYFSYAGEKDDKRNTEVASATLRGNALTDLTTIFVAEPKTDGGNHYGSRLLITPDNHLYITLGERFDYMDEAQNPMNNLGTVVRLNPDGSIPSDNPFANGIDGLPNVYSYGHRNAQGIIYNLETSQVWVHEHGPRGGDEINVLEPGANYGWPKVSYGDHYWGTKIDDPGEDGFTQPIHHWTPSIAPSGMVYYTGDAFPDWYGDIFVGALVKTHLRRLEVDGQTITGEEEILKDMNARIRDVAQGPDGYLYLLTDDDNGHLLRLKPAE